MALCSGVVAGEWVDMPEDGGWITLDRAVPLPARDPASIKGVIRSLAAHSAKLVMHGPSGSDSSVFRDALCVLALAHFDDQRQDSLPAIVDALELAIAGSDAGRWGDVADHATTIWKLGDDYVKRF